VTFFELLNWSLWDALRPKRVLTLVIVSLAAPLFAGLNRVIAPNDYPDAIYALMVTFLSFNFAMVLLTIVFACGIISNEVVGRTIPFLLTKPIHRYKIFFAKWLAAVLVVSIATMFSIGATGVICFGISFGNTPVFRDLLITPVGVITYCSLFAFLSTISTKPWLIGVIFGFFWETWVPLFPGDIQKLSVMSYIRTLSPQLDVGPQDEFNQIAQFLNVEQITTTEAWNTLSFLTLAALITGALIFSYGQYVPKEETV
jgi:ABC-2 type transport system permease protein